MSDLVNESLTLSEEDAVAVASTSRLSPAAVTPSAGASSKNKDAGQPASEPSVPSLSSLASEAVEELPSVKLYKRLHPPTHKLIAITKNMNQHLTSLLVNKFEFSRQKFKLLILLFKKNRKSSRIEMKNVSG